MKSQEFKDLIPEYILGRLTEQEDERFSQYLKNNPEALEEWSGFDSDLLNQNVEPSSKMDDKFYDFLNKEIDNKVDDKVKNLVVNRTLKNKIPKHFLSLIAASIILFFGFFIGKQWQSPSTDPNYNISEFEVIKNETDLVRTELVMSLADETSASKRLQALSEATKLNNATEKVIMALFKMLNTDSNVNVRLAAVTSLSKYVDNPKVREGLILSITNQESPLVQIALADLMVTLKEQKSINSMETLLQKPDINSAVKQKLEESIKQII